MRIKSFFSSIFLILYDLFNLKLLFSKCDESSIDINDQLVSSSTLTSSSKTSFSSVYEITSEEEQEEEISSIELDTSYLSVYSELSVD